MRIKTRMPVMISNFTDLEFSREFINLVILEGKNEIEAIVTK